MKACGQNISHVNALPLVVTATTQAYLRIHSGRRPEVRESRSGGARAPRQAACGQGAQRGEKSCRLSETAHSFAHRACADRGQAPPSSSAHILESRPGLMSAISTRERNRQVVVTLAVPLRPRKPAIGNRIGVLGRGRLGRSGCLWREQAGTQAGVASCVRGTGEVS